MAERSDYVALARRYARDVVANRQPAGRYIRLACQRFLDDLKSAPSRGLRFDRGEAGLASYFFHLLRHSKGEWAGQEFTLEPWEAFIIANIFGWRRVDDSTRRFRAAYVEIPRKNGKSTLSAGVGLYLFWGEGEPGSETYSAATKRDQARIVHQEAVRMVKASPGLSKVIGRFRDNLHHDPSNSKYEPLGADADTMDGLNVHGAIIDELHAHKTREVWDVLDTATSARRQPLIFAITTAGFDRESVCYEQHEYTVQVLTRQITDDSWFGYIAAADEGDDWRDEHTWRKANPNYGVSVKPDDLRRKAEKAGQAPAALNAFLRRHLNIWTQQHSRWLDIERWDALRAEYTEGSLAGQRCYGGLDLSSVSDLTAWALAFRDPEEDVIRLMVRSWCPEARLTARGNRYAQQYQAWHRDGWLDVTPGNATDYGYIKAQIVADAASFDLVDFNVDRLFQAHQLMIELADEGLQPVPMGQGFYSMAGPMKEFERRQLAGTLAHDGNPVLRWAIGNVVAKEDPAGNLKPDKATSQGKIDPFVAVVMAIDRASRHETPPAIPRIRSL